MNVSVGIMCYNEGKNIENLLSALLSQKTEEVSIDEIIVISSGCTDNTDACVCRILEKNSKVKLFTQKERKGKAHAINIFLKKAKNRILVLESADTLPKEDTIEKLCTRLKNPDAGIVSGRPIPQQNSSKLMNSIVQLQWELHHEIAKENPKFGEIIAFRKIMKKISISAVDEEEIASMIKRAGLKLLYEPGAVVYNKGPENIREFIRQRRRIYAGHLELRKRTKYEASTLKVTRIISKLIKTRGGGKNIFFLLTAVIMEGIGRILGLIDYMTGKKHSVWKISGTTKELR